MTRNLYKVIQVINLLGRVGTDMASVDSQIPAHSENENVSRMSRKAEMSRECLAKTRHWRDIKMSRETLGLSFTRHFYFFMKKRDILKKTRHFHDLLVSRETF